MNGQAKFSLWSLVDEGVFEGLTRNGQPITKTYDGSKEALLETALTPNTASEKVPE